MYTITITTNNEHFNDPCDFNNVYPRNLNTVAYYNKKGIYKKKLHFNNTLVVLIFSIQFNNIVEKNGIFVHF